jgi:hypothetical protein
MKNGNNLRETRLVHHTEGDYSPSRRDVLVKGISIAASVFCLWLGELKRH